jgi:hypothetical protein
MIAFAAKTFVSAFSLIGPASDSPSMVPPHLLESDRQVQSAHAEPVLIPLPPADTCHCGDNCSCSRPCVCDVNSVKRKPESPPARPKVKNVPAVPAPFKPEVVKASWGLPPRTVDVKVVGISSYRNDGRTPAINRTPVAPAPELAPFIPSFSLPVVSDFGGSYMPSFSGGFMGGAGGCAGGSCR